ncbi:uncharacterized protein ACIQIH_015543 isoform 2-T2 [Cyanocitta cristata]
MAPSLAPAEGFILKKFNRINYHSPQPFDCSFEYIIHEELLSKCGAASHMGTSKLTESSSGFFGKPGSCVFLKDRWLHYHFPCTAVSDKSHSTRAGPRPGRLFTVEVESPVQCHRVMLKQNKLRQELSQS